MTVSDGNANALCRYSRRGSILDNAVFHLAPQLIGSRSDFSSSPRYRYDIVQSSQAQIIFLPGDLPDRFRPRPYLCKVHQWMKVGNSWKRELTLTAKKPAFVQALPLLSNTLICWGFICGHHNSTLRGSPYGGAVVKTTEHQVFIHFSRVEISYSYVYVRKYTNQLRRYLGVITKDHNC
jgi:hypothetical protein